MANCQKNTNYLIRNATGQQVRDIRLSSGGMNLEIFLIANGKADCTFNIDGATATGIKLIGNNLQIVDAIDGLTNQVTAAAAGAEIKVQVNGTSQLEIIGVSDITMNMQANIRYDSATEKVIMHY